MSRKVIDMHTRLVSDGQGQVEIDYESARAMGENKKFEFYLLKYNLYQYSKKNKEIRLIGNIKYKGATLKSSPVIAVNDYEFYLLDNERVWRLDWRDELILDNAHELLDED